MVVGVVLVLGLAEEERVCDRTQSPEPASTTMPAAAAAAIVVLAGSGLWVLSQTRSSSASPKTSTTPTTMVSPSGPATPASDVPDRFLGTWTGYLSTPQNPGARGYFKITIRRGRIGDVVASTRNQTLTGSYCDGTAKLAS